MAKKKMAKDVKKTIDGVAKAGTTPPDSSARPVIVSHKPMIKDPMVNEKGEGTESEFGTEEVTKEEKAPSEKANKVIALITPETEAPQEASSKPKEQDNDDENDAPGENDTEFSAIVDVVVSQASDKNKKTREAEADLARREQIDKLIESKTYFVKVKAPKAKRNKRALFVVFIVAVLGLLGVLAAADASILPIDVPFDFIKEKKVESEKSTEQNQPITADVNKDSETTNTEQAVIPDDFTVFEDSELGIKFGYPKSWGVAALGDYAYSEETNGSNRVVYSKGITFSNNSEAKVVLNASDMIPIARDGYSSPSSIYDWCSDDDGTITAMNNSARSCGPSDAEDFTVYNSKEKDSSIPAIFFTSQISSEVDKPEKTWVLLARVNANDKYKMFMLINSSPESAEQELESIYKTITIIN